jgi:hypothetical protein
VDWQRSRGNVERVVVDEGGKEENKKLIWNHFC